MPGVGRRGQQATGIHADQLADQHDLDDTEREVLVDLLRGDDQYVDLQQAAQRCELHQPSHQPDEGSVGAAVEGASAELQRALDMIAEQYRRDAEAIASLARDVYGKGGAWGPMIDLYQSGYVSVDGIRSAGRASLVAAGLHPDVAEEIIAAVEVED
jgi:hypothetical protein